MKMVLQKYIASSGKYSRRQAEELIRAGKVRVNSRAAELGMKVGGADVVKVGNSIVEPAAEKICIILNKPEGYVCSNRRFKGEKNIFDLLADKDGSSLNHGLFAVGRLDKMSEGLVLLTNDGGLANKLTHPKYEHEKEYAVQLKIKNEKLKINNIEKNFLKGVDIGNNEIGRAKSVEYLGKNEFRIILTEGKKRQIRRMFASLGLDVIKLQRVRIGSGDLLFELGKLPKGQWKRVKMN